MIAGSLDINEIQGESKKDGVEDQIDVFGVHWRVRQKDFAREGAGLTQGRGEVSSFTFHKYCDAASAYLAQAAMQGKALPEVIFTARKDSGDEYIDYLIVTMSNCVISDFEMENDGNDPSNSLIKEKVAIACDKIAIKYTVQEEDGSSGGEHEFEYDIKAGA
ncbi:MAG: type VI secretion system tube protein Hcp [Pseudomonadota bacterium]